MTSRPGPDHLSLARRRPRRSLATSLAAVLGVVGAATLVAAPAGAAEPAAGGVVALPSAGGVDAVAVPVTGADARVLTGARVAVDKGPAGAPATTAPASAGPGFTATVAVPDGQMIGVEWDGAPTGAVSMRSSTAGRWSGWVELEANPDETPDQASAEFRPALHSAVGPVWTGSGTAAVQVRVTAGVLANLRVDVLRTDGAADPAVPPAVAPDAPASGTGRAMTAPAVQPRSAWGAGPWRSSTRGCGSGPGTATLRNGIVHHTVTGNTYSTTQVDDVLRSIYYFHTQTQGWCDIAYNFLVDRFGGMWEGRTGSLAGPIVGGHAKGFNTGSVGVSLLGDYETVAVPPAAVSSVRRILAWRLGDAGIDPNGSVRLISAGSTRFAAGTAVTLPRISGHRDTSLTACPGTNAYRRLGEIKTAVSGDVLRSGPFDRLPGHVPEARRPAVEVLDRWGGIHPAGGGRPVASSGYWSGWEIARGIAGNATAGYVVDAWGGLHEYGSAPAARPRAYWAGQDMAVSISRGPRTGSGYVLDAFGGIHPFGPANLTIPTRQRWPGWRIARDITSTSGGNGGYVLDGWGGLHAFGGAPTSRPSGYWPGKDIARAVALRPDGPGGYVLDGFGGLWAFGGAPRIASGHLTPGVDSHRDIVMLWGNRGYTVDADGRAWPFGGAPAITPTLTWPGTGLTAGLVTSG